MNLFEIEFLRFLRNISNSFTDFLMEAITMLGEQMVVIVILMILYFAYDKKVGKKIAYAMFSSVLINGVVKGLVQRIRPFKLDPTLDSIRIETATGYSFPSGHTQNTTTMFVSLPYHFKKKSLWIAGITISILVGFSRLALGVHYPTDVLVGFALGLGAAILFSYLYDKFSKTNRSEIILFGITLLIMTPFLFIFYRKDYNDILPFKGFYQIYAIFFAFSAGVLIDNLFVKFETKAPLKIILFRILGAGIIYLLFNYGLKFVFPKENMFFVMLRYFITVFSVIGIYPLIFKNLLFKSKQKDS